MCALLACLTAGALTVVAAPDDRDDEVRALWVTRATLTSPEAIVRMIRAADEGGFNTIVVQVRGRGDAFYRSTLEPRAAELAARPGFDPLAEVIAGAHAAGLRVHAWVNVNLVSSATNLASSPQHILYRHPEWLMVPRELAIEMRTVDPRSPEYVGRLARWTRAHHDEVEGLYASPLHPAAAAHIAAVVSELAGSYAIDGLHVDYARFPNAQFDYSRPAIEQFKQTVRAEISDADRRRADAQEALDPTAYPALFADRWVSFRQSRLTTLMMRVRTAARTVRPDLLISAAVLPDVTVAAESRLQDWRTWVEQGLVDVLCPMAYSPEPQIFERQIADAVAFAGPRRVWAGVGAYRLDPIATLRHITAARRQRAAGIILFSYDALVAPPYSASSLAELGRAAFTPGPRTQ